MDWLFRWTNAEANLSQWEQRPFSHGVEAGPRPNDNRDNHERVVGVEPPGPPMPNGVARRVADAIFRFDVFPPDMLTSVLRRRPIEVGDTVCLRYFFAPGVDLFFGARVFERFDDTIDGQWRCGFRYRTLQGHPECGEETFIVEKNLATGQVTAALRSWSRPGLLIAKIAYPIVRVWQLRAGRAALDHLEQIAHPEPTSPAMPTNAHNLFVRRNLRTGFLRSDRI